MRKLYLHIGTEKTGTTSIQSFLNTNRVVLSDNGYHVLKCAGQENHRAIPSYCMADNYYDDFFLSQGLDNLEKKQQFRNELREAFNEELGSLEDNIHSVIITSEHFHSRLGSVEAVEVFKDLISDHFSEIEIICYLKEQSSLASSRYTTGIRSGANIEFTAFLQNCSPDNPYYNYHSLLKRWSDVFSPDSLNVRIFSKDEFYNNNLIDDFCIAINEILLSFTNRKINIENESFSNLGITIGRAINSIYHIGNRNSFINKDRKHVLQYVSQFFPGHENNIDIEQYRHIQTLFQESNQKVAQQYFKNRDHLFPWNPLPLANSLIKEEQVTALANIIDDFKSAPLIPKESIDLLRDSALLLEDIDLNKAYHLMKLAQKNRPKGRFINQKIEEYEKRL